MPEPFLLVVLALATFRATRVVTTDTLTGALRDRLYVFAWDDSKPIDLGGGAWEPSPRAVWRTYVHALLTCQACLGVWIAAGVYAAWDRGGDVAHTIIAVAALAAVQNVLALGADLLGEAIERVKR